MKRVRSGPRAVADELTWIGHSSLALSLDGIRVLSDPVLTNRVAHLRRRSAPPSPQVRRCDLVLLSHAHLDHLHRRSLRMVAAASKDAVVVTPRGTRRLVAGLGWREIHEVAVGDTLEVGGLHLSATEARHKGGRGRRDDPSMPPVGYLVQRAGRRVYLAGDTDLFPGMADLGPLDLAAVPIFGWWRRLGVGHLNPETAAEAVALLDPARVLPVHWGTFAPETGVAQPKWLDQPSATFASALARRGLADRLISLTPGGSATW